MKRKFLRASLSHKNILSPRFIWADFFYCVREKSWEMSMLQYRYTRRTFSNLPLRDCHTTFAVGLLLLLTLVVSGLLHLITLFAVGLLLVLTLFVAGLLHHTPLLQWVFFNF